MIIIYLPAKGIKEIALNHEAKIGDLIKHATPATVGLDDNLEDQEVYILDKPEELSKDLHLKEVHDSKAFVIHRCKKIVVTVIYPGKPPVTVHYPPSIKIDHIRKDVINKLDIDVPTSQKLELFESQDQNAKMNRNYPIGYYTTYPTCGLTIYLVDPNAFAG